MCRKEIVAHWLFIFLNQVGGYLRRIENVEVYPEGDAIYDVSEKETSEDARPEYKDLEIDINDYDQIYIGYPIWAYNMPQITVYSAILLS